MIFSSSIHLPSNNIISFFFVLNKVGEGRIRENDERGEFNYDIFDIF
jgi:hypothetical protein